MKKYEIHNQLTGLSEETYSFEEAVELQKELRLKYCEYQNIYEITIMLQNEDGSWTQSRIDENGDALPSTSNNLKII